MKLSRPGTYEVSELIETSNRTRSTGIAGMVLNRISRLTGREEEDVTVAGAPVRARQPCRLRLPGPPARAWTS
ncbi:MAG: hypothetical protein ACOC0E_05990 [Spirochaetota bacterium]